MNFDETIRHSGDRKQYRRRRKYQGATWTPENKNAPKPDGLWCRACMRTHGYMSLNTSYNLSSSGWELAWLCKQTKNVVGTIQLGGNQ